MRACVLLRENEIGRTAFGLKNLKEASGRGRGRISFFVWTVRCTRQGGAGRGEGEPPITKQSPRIGLKEAISKYNNNNNRMSEDINICVVAVRRGPSVNQHDVESGYDAMRLDMNRKHTRTDGESLGVQRTARGFGA